MKKLISCPECSQELELEDDLPSKAQKLQCPQCQHKFYLGSSEDTIPDLNPSQLLMRGWNTPQLTGDANWTPPEAEEMNDVFDDRYQVSKLLGRGGMGAVYLAVDTRLDRKVAIKTLPPELGGNDVALARFEREAKAMAALEHPNIINVYDYGNTAAGHLYIVMEFIDGMDLHQLRASGNLDLNGALEVVSQVCSALQYAHSKGIIHRDIKPANVLVSHEGAVKVADFGLAKVFGTESRPNIDPTLTNTGTSMGTPDYMAPEQRQGEAVDHRADIYALGVMLYDLLTGAPPRGAWTAPSQKVEIDVRLDEIIIRALQENPVARYQAAVEVQDDVDSVKTSTGGSPIPVGSAVDPLPSTQRKSSGIAKPRTAPGSHTTSQQSTSHASTQQPVHDVPSLDAIVATTRSTNRTMLLLGTFAILTIGAIAIYVGIYKKDGDTYNTVNNTSYQEIQNNYFSQIIVNGTTSAKELEKIQGIKPYGTLFIGISKNTLTLEEAKDLATRTGSTILDYTTDQPNKPAPLNQWITSAFDLQQKAWVSIHTQYQLIDDNALLTTADADAKHHVLLAWQGPKELMMKAEHGEFKEEGANAKTSDIVSHGLNGIFSSPVGNGSGRYAFNVFQGGRVSGLNFDGNPVSNVSFTGLVSNEKVIGSFPHPYSKDTLIKCEISPSENGNFVVTQHDETNGIPSGRRTFVMKRLDAKGVEEAIKAAENGPLNKEMQLVLDRCREFALNESKSNSELLPSIDPKRKIFITSHSAPRSLYENYEPGKWRFETEGQTRGLFIEKQRDDRTIELIGETLNLRILLDEKRFRLFKDGELSHGGDGKWIDSLEDGNPNIVIRGIPTDALGFDGHYYKFYPSKKSWEEAQKECEARGGQLATANTWPEFHQIALLAGPNLAWLGGHNSEVEKRHSWIDGEFIPNRNWHWNNPNAAKYVGIQRGLMHSSHADANYAGYICEWKSDAEIPRIPVPPESGIEMKIPADAAEYQGNFYQAYNLGTNWHLSYNYCKERGGRLAILNSQPELEFVATLLEKNNMKTSDTWLGATNMNLDGKWKWIDGSEFQPSRFEDVATNPQAVSEFLILNNGKIRSRQESTFHGLCFVCEWEGEPKDHPATPPEADTPEATPETEKRTLTNKAGKSIEVEILSATETHVKVRRLSDDKKFDLKLETLSEEDQEFIDAWKVVNP